MSGGPLEGCSLDSVKSVLVEALPYFISCSNGAAFELPFIPFSFIKSANSFCQVLGWTNFLIVCCHVPCRLQEGCFGLLPLMPWMTSSSISRRNLFSPSFWPHCSTETNPVSLIVLIYIFIHICGICHLIKKQNWNSCNVHAQQTIHIKYSIKIY